MKFNKIDPEVVENAFTQNSMGDRSLDGLRESYFVVKTANDITFSEAHSAGFGVYFYPRVGTHGPVIMLNDVVELHQVCLSK